MIQICTFKEKEKEGGKGGPQLGGQWKVPSLVALDMNPMLRGQWGNILLSDQWKVPNLVAFGMSYDWLPLEVEREAFFSLPSTFYPIKFYLNLFSIDFKVLFYHGSNHYLRLSFLFLDL
jgi:hypothetical protein